MKSAGILFILATVCCISCKKYPGEGGTSVIWGKVYVLDVNAQNQVQAEFYGPEERVYLIFGDDEFYGLDTRTSYDGTYEFQYLRKGKYKVFAYSDCLNCSAGIEPVFAEAEITKNNSVLELPDLIIRK